MLFFLRGYTLFTLLYMKWVKKTIHMHVSAWNLVISPIS